MAQAEPLYREALTNAVRLWPNDPARWQWMLNGLADVVRSQGKSADTNRVLAELPKPAVQAQPGTPQQQPTRKNVPRGK